VWFTICADYRAMSQERRMRARGDYAPPRFHVDDAIAGDAERPKRRGLQTFAAHRLHGVTPDFSDIHLHSCHNPERRGRRARRGIAWEENLDTDLTTLLV
jgi:hypothetical protein